MNKVIQDICNNIGFYITNNILLSKKMIDFAYRNLNQTNITKEYDYILVSKNNNIVIGCYDTPFGIFFHKIGYSNELDIFELIQVLSTSLVSLKSVKGWFFQVSDPILFFIYHKMYKENIVNVIPFEVAKSMHENKRWLNGDRIVIEANSTYDGMSKYAFTVLVPNNESIYHPNFKILYTKVMFGNPLCEK